MRIVGHDSDMAALRVRNAAVCVRVLRERRSATLSDLVTATGLSRPTLESILGELQAAGFVSAENLAPQSGAGRPARTFSFVADAAYVVGVDLGLDTVRAVLADLAGSVLASVELQVRPGADGIDRLRCVDLVVEEVCRRAACERAAISAVAVALSGIVSADGRVLASDRVPEWSGVDLASRLSAMLGLPVRVDNDVKAAAVAEHHVGAARLVDDVVFAKVDRLVSAAIILQGRVRDGHHSAAGEIGTLQETGHESDYVSDAALVAGLRNSLARAADGDAVSADELLDYITRVAYAIAPVVLTIDPDLVVLGGGVSEIGEPLVSRVRSELANVAGRAAIPAVMPSLLGSYAVVLGALVRAFSLAAVTVFSNPEVLPPSINVSADRPGTLRDQLDGITVHAAGAPRTADTPSGQHSR